MKGFRVAAVLVAVVLIIAGCGKEYTSLKPVVRDGFYFDTVISVYIYEEDEDKANEALDKCFELAEYYEGIFSNTVKGSDVYRINESKGEAVEVSDDTIEVIKRGMYFGDLSGGLFDITMGGVSDLWGFGKEEKVPEIKELNEAISHVGYKNIVIDGNMVSLKDNEAKVDLGGIAKGYIADMMKKEMLNMGVSSGIISLGGNVSLIGEKPDKEAFKVGIYDPFSQEGGAIVSLSERDVSVVTSGTYQRYFTEDEKTYHHILNPKDGYPEDNGLVSVSIICESSTDADALSTTCFLMGENDGMKLIEDLEDTEAIFVFEDEEIKHSSGLKL